MVQTILVDIDAIGYGTFAGVSTDWLIQVRTSVLQLGKLLAMCLNELNEEAHT